MRPVNPLLYSFTQAEDVVRGKLADSIDSTTRDDSQALWTTVFLRDCYNRFISLAYSRNPHLKGMKIDLSSEFNEALVLFMTYQSFELYSDDKYNLKRAEAIILLYESEMGKISLR